ncbi:peptidase S24-like protein [Pseudomonas sp. SLBN-26]|nr:peptidase S24-like protein [Pseudomonas sp. SLBN-26]
MAIRRVMSPSMKKWNLLAKARMKELGVTQEQLAERIGVTQGAVAHWLNGRREPGLTRINRILACLQMPTLSIGGQLVQSAHDPDGNEEAREIPDGIIPMTIRESEAPRYEYEIELPLLKEATSLEENSTSLEELDYSGIRFSRHALQARQIDPALAACVIVCGDSMAPLFPDGAILGIDRGRREVIDGKTYALLDAGMLRVKILHRLPAGQVRLRSYQRDEYPDEERALAELEIVGQVFWSSVLW